MTPMVSFLDGVRAWFAPYRKAVWAFVSLLLTNAFTNLLLAGEPWPGTAKDWVRWAVTIIGGTWLVYRSRANEVRGDTFTSQAGRE